MENFHVFKKEINIAKKLVYKKVKNKVSFRGDLTFDKLYYINDNVINNYLSKSFVIINRNLFITNKKSITLKFNSLWRLSNVKLKHKKISIVKIKLDIVFFYCKGVINNKINNNDFYEHFYLKTLLRSEKNKKIKKNIKFNFLKNGIVNKNNTTCFIYKLNNNYFKTINGFNLDNVINSSTKIILLLKIFFF